MDGNALTSSIIETGNTTMSASFLTNLNAFVLDYNMLHIDHISVTGRLALEYPSFMIAAEFLKKRKLATSRGSNIDLKPTRGALGP